METFALPVNQHSFTMEQRADDCTLAKQSVNAFSEGEGENSFFPSEEKVPP